MKKIFTWGAVIALVFQSLLPLNIAYAAERVRLAPEAVRRAYITRTTDTAVRQVTTDDVSDRNPTYTPVIRDTSAVNPDFDGGATESTCTQSERPDIAITNVQLTAVTDAESENTSVAYTFSVSIKNTQSHVDHSSVWLLAFASDELIGKAAYAALGDGNSAVAVKKVENAPMGKLSLTCAGETSEYTVENVTVIIPKQTDSQSISFVIDGFDVVLEENEGKNGGVFSIMSNNVLTYSFAHPFDQFQLANPLESTESIQVDTFLIDITEANNLEALNSIDAGLAVVAVEDVGVEDMSIQETSAIEGTDTIFTQGYPKDSFQIGDLDATDVVLMTKEGSTWNAPAVTMKKGKSPGVLLVLYTADKEYIPLYVYAYIEEESIDYPVSCVVGDSGCMPENYFFVDTGWATIEYHPNEDTIVEPTNVSTFTLCKVGPSSGSIKKILLTEEIQYLNKTTTSGNSTKDLLVTLDGESIAESSDELGIVSAQSVYAYDISEHDMNLPTPKVIEPGACASMEVFLSNVHHIGASNFSIQKLIGNVPLYTEGADGMYHQVGEELNLDEYPTTELGEMYAIPPYPFRANGATVMYAPTKSEGLLVSTADSSEKIIYVDPNLTQPSANEWKANHLLLGWHKKFGSMTLGNHYNQAQYVSSVHVRVTTNFSDELEAFPLYTEVTAVPLEWDRQERRYAKFENEYISDELTLLDVPASGTIDLQIPIERIIVDGYETNIGFYIKDNIAYEGTVSMELIDVLDEKGESVDARYSESLNAPNPSFWIEDYSGAFSGYSQSATYIIPPDEFDGEITVNYYPADFNSQKKWVSQYDTSQHLFDVNVSVEGFLPEVFEMLQFDTPLQIEVKTNHDGPLTLSILLFQQLKDETEIPEIIEVKNGDIISFDLNEMKENSINPFYGYTHYGIEINAVDYPANDDVTYVKFIVKPLSYTPSAGVSTQTNIYTYVEADKEWAAVPFVEDAKGKTLLLGNEILWQSQNLNKASNFYFVDEVSGEQVNMNHTCFDAQGNMKITKVVYTHDTHAEQPFEDVLLSYWGTTVYLPLTSWTETESIFELSEPLKLDHNSNVCFMMDVYNPLEELDDMFFDLSYIEAEVHVYDDEFAEEISIPVILQNGELLSPLNTVKGAKTDFIM